METTRKSINEQIEEVFKIFDEQTSQVNNCEDGFKVMTHQMKVIIQHVMKLEAKSYYIQKKLDATLGTRPQTPRLNT